MAEIHGVWHGRRCNGSLQKRGNVFVGVELVEAVTPNSREMVRAPSAAMNGGVMEPVRLFQLLFQRAKYPSTRPVWGFVTAQCCWSHVRLYISRELLTLVMLYLGVK